MGNECRGDCIGFCHWLIVVNWSPTQPVDVCESRACRCKLMFVGLVRLCLDKFVFADVFTGHRLIAVCTMILLELSVRRPVPGIIVQKLQVMKFDVACSLANLRKGSASTESATSSAIGTCGPITCLTNAILAFHVAVFVVHHARPGFEVV